MPNPTSPGSPRPFDVKTIEHLIGLMAEHDLSEIALAEGEHRIRLRKGGLQTVTTVAAPTVVAGPAPSTQSSAPVAPAEAPKKSNLIEIKSPMVGTYYAKASPDKPDFVSVGSKVTPTTVVCKLEAMKIFNDIAAECSGTIVEVCIKNAQPVDFGMVLFRVEPS